MRLSPACWFGLGADCGQQVREVPIVSKGEPPSAIGTDEGISCRDLVASPCPVCGHGVAAAFFAGGDQPLATLGWPQSAEAAVSMRRLPHDFVQCPACTHVWNRSFRYEDVPYRDQPNRMFNAGAIWRGHMAASGRSLLERLPSTPTLVEIGCGEGQFMKGLAEACEGQGRFIGFDPNTHAVTGQGLEFQARLFDPLTDIAALAPDAIIMRHVVEHLTEPAAFLDQLAWGASLSGRSILAFIETPCIDRVFSTGRLADFFYEHMSHFSTESFRELLMRAGTIELLEHGYDGEVVFGIVRLEPPAGAPATVRAARAFADRAANTQSCVRRQIDEIAASGRRVAVWGGTGKGAAFIHQFGLDRVRFPIVVDSDPDKVGTFVPGTGQAIAFRDVLKGEPVDLVIIPTQWRAADIVQEMAREAIEPQKVLIEHDGRLVDYHRDPHPYR